MAKTTPKKKAKKKKARKKSLEMEGAEAIISEAEKDQLNDLLLVRAMIPKICTAGSKEERQPRHHESDGQWLLRLIDLELDSYKDALHKKAKLSTRIQEAYRNVERVALSQAVKIVDLIGDRKEIRAHVREARGHLQNLLGECGVTSVEMVLMDKADRTSDELMFIRKEARKLDSVLKAIDQEATKPTSDEVDTRY